MEWLRPAGLKSPLRVCLQVVYFDWSLRTFRDTPTRRRKPLKVLKKTFSAYQCDGKKGVNMPLEVAVRWMQPRLRRIRPRGAEWLLRASVGTSIIYRCVPPTHEYGTKPFLRWVRSQGRSPHASGKAKNTFGPVGIPLFGALQASGNKPTYPPPTRRR